MPKTPRIKLELDLSGGSGLTSGSIELELDVDEFLEQMDEEELTHLLESIDRDKVMSILHLQEEDE